MNKKNYEVELRGNTRSYRSELGRAITSNDRFNNSMRGLSQGAQAIQGPMGGVASRVSVVNSLFSSGAAVTSGLAAALAGLVAVGYKSLQVFNEYEKSQLRTEALVRATGNAAGFTAEQLQQQANQVALSTLASVQGITEAQNVLQTFKSVSGETFTQAVELSQDMAAVFGGTAKDKALQLGKALEDPVAGINALKRSGVSFTSAQKDMIRSMVEMGDTAGAQKVILEQLAGQVGGAGSAEAGGLAGSVDTLGQRWDELLLSFSESSSIGGGVKSWLDGISYSLDKLRGKIAPTIDELEAELETLEASQQKATTGRGGNAAKAANAVRSAEAEALKEQILQLKAEQGDLQALDQLIEQRSNELKQINTRLPEASSRGVGRFGKSEKEKLQQQQRKAAAELQEFKRQKKQLEDANQAHVETQAAIKKEADQAAQVKRQEEAEKMASSLRAQYQRIYDEALAADGREVELTNLRYERKVEEMNAELELMREKGLLTQELEKEHQEALNNLLLTKEEKVAELNQREIDAATEKYAAIREAALEAGGKDEELAQFRHDKRVEEIEAELDMLREKGLATQEIEAAHKQAMEDLEATHQGRLAEIRDEAREEELKKEEEKKARQQEGYGVLFDAANSFFDGMEGREAGYARMALSIGETLLNEKKRKSLQSIWTNTMDAAMGAYNALASIPYIGPVLGGAAYAGVVVTGAAAAAKLTGMAHSGMTNIPSEGTYLLDGGERVVQPDQNRDLTRFLSSSETNNSSSLSVKNETHIHGDASNRDWREIALRDKRFIRLFKARLERPV
ncbi:hypothetical protein D1814_17070 [Alteromonas sp. BL110]|uniref:phage tail length tape measure family protein n=1 Tax=Alteromonas sp. BL110 TaxID=1714845 RepID=UPI000E526D85|nr:phage tail length tape measure family protein [Alteromonas sp. BL110]AXT40264.1 hypothetical protein D1814_17070 [Alteromonas sp. BL110]RKM79496.1 hypothetical protein D7031_11065 [Alteromonas sp. BL110]